MAFVEIFGRAGNEVLEINPTSSYIDIHLTNHGSSWLWAAFSVFSLLTLIHAAIFGFSNSRNQTIKKAIFVGPLFTNFVMAIAYFTYASNLGYTGIKTEFHHVTTSEGLGYRQIFYVKYIGYFLSWPFVLYAIEVATHTLDLSSKTSAGETFSGFIGIISSLFTKFLATEVFVLGLLIGSLIESTYKWGYFTFAVFGQLYALTLIIVSVSKNLRSINSNRIGTILISFELVVWILYPIAWGLSEGGNVIQPDSEAAFFGVLDLITFAIVPTVLTFLNASGLDENVFLKFNWNNHHSTNEKIIESPRASGDTAVPQTSVAETGANNVQAETV